MDKSMNIATKINNPFWEEVQHLFHGKDHFELAYEQMKERENFCRRFAWAIPDPESLVFVAKYLGPYAVEMGAGNGYWAWLLRQLGTHVEAYDKYPPDNPEEHKNDYFLFMERTWHPVREAGPEILRFHAHHSLFLCWPPFRDSMAFDCLQAYRGERLVYIGEEEEGCTANNKFFSLLYREWEEVANHAIAQWYGVHDCIQVFDRKDLQTHVP